MAECTILPFLNAHPSTYECLMSIPDLNNRNTRFSRFWKWAGGATNDNSLPIRRSPPSTTRWQQCSSSELNGADWKCCSISQPHLFVPHQLHRVLLWLFNVLWDLVEKTETMVLLVWEMFCAAEMNKTFLGLGLNDNCFSELEWFLTQPESLSL